MFCSDVNQEKAYLLTLKISYSEIQKYVDNSFNDSCSSS